MQDEIHVILDSVSCVQETAFMNDPRVHMVPLITELGDLEWRDGTKTLEELVSLIEATGELPKTSQPPLGDILNLFVALAKEGKKAFFITLSSGISGTYQTACMAAEEVKHKYPDADIRVLDSLNAALPLTAVARDLLAKADAGCRDMDELERFAKEQLASIHTFFTVETLDYLIKGGRISKASGIIGGILGIRPILTFDEAGHIVALDKCRTRKKALLHCMDLACSCGKVEHIYVCGCFCQEDMEHMAAEMAARNPGATVELAPLGTVLLAHVGPGILGLLVRTVKG